MKQADSASFSEDDLKILLDKIDTFGRVLHDYHVRTDFVANPTPEQTNTYLEHASKIQEYFNGLSEEAKAFYEHGGGVAALTAEVYHPDAERVYRDYEEHLFSSTENTDRFHEDRGLIRNVFSRLEEVQHQISAIQEREEGIRSISHEQNSDLSSEHAGWGSGAGAYPGLAQTSLDPEAEAIISHKVAHLSDHFAQLSHHYEQIATEPHSFKVEVDQFGMPHTELASQQFGQSSSDPAHGHIGYDAAAQNNEQSIVHANEPHALTSHHDDLNNFGSLTRLGTADHLQILSEATPNEVKTTYQHIGQEANIVADNTMSLSQNSSLTALQNLGVLQFGTEGVEDVVSCFRHQVNSESATAQLPDSDVISHDLNDGSLSQSLHASGPYLDSSAGGEAISSNAEAGFNDDTASFTPSQASEVLDQVSGDMNPMTASMEGAHHWVTGIDTQNTEASSSASSGHSMGGDDVSGVHQGTGLIGTD